MIDLTEEKKQTESSIDYNLRDHILELLNKTYNQEGEAYTLNFRDFGEFVSKEYFNKIVSELVAKLDKVIGEQRNSYIKDQTLFTVKIKNEIKDAIESHYIVVGNALFRDYPDYIRKIKIRLGWIEINDDGIYHIEDYYGYYRESDYKEGEFPTCEVVRKDDYAKVNELRSQGFRLIELEGFKWVRVEKYNKEDERVAIFKDNNTIYQPETVYVKGSMVEYEGEEEPEKESFIFDGWSPNTGKPINNNTIYVPKYYKTNGVLDITRPIPDSIITIFKHQENYPIGSWFALDFPFMWYREGNYYNPINKSFINIFLVKFSNKDWAIVFDDGKLYGGGGIIIRSENGDNNLLHFENFQSSTGIYSYEHLKLRKYINTTFLDELSDFIPVEFLTEKRRVSFGVNVTTDTLPWVDPSTLPIYYDTQLKKRVKRYTDSRYGQYYSGDIYIEYVDTGEVFDHRSETVYCESTNMVKARYDDKIWLPNVYELSGQDHLFSKNYYYDGSQREYYNIATEQEGTKLNIDETFKNLPASISYFWKKRVKFTRNFDFYVEENLGWRDCFNSSMYPSCIFSTSYNPSKVQKIDIRIARYDFQHYHYKKDNHPDHIKDSIRDSVNLFGVIMSDDVAPFKPIQPDQSSIYILRLPLLCITFP